jgi:hypothetical protein
MKFFYRPLLKQALQLSWRNKYLWFFGLFAALLGNGGEYNVLINNLNLVVDQGTLLDVAKSLYQGGSLSLVGNNFTSLFTNFSITSLLGFLFFLAIGVFLVWLAILSQAALVSGAYKLQRNAPTNFSTDFVVGKRNFWKVLWLNILGKIVIYGLLVILSLPFFVIFLNQDGSAWMNVILILSFIIFVPITIIISFLIKYAVIYVVAQGETAKAGLRSSWLLFKKNWIASLEMAAILFVINIAAGIGLLLSLLILSVPFILLGLVFFSLQVAPLFWLVVIVAVILFILLIFLFGAVLSTFQNAAWVLLFVRLGEGQVFPKVIRLATSLFGRRQPEPVE